MRSIFAVFSLFLVLPAFSCSGGEDESDPWATTEGEGAAPKTQGFGQEDFQGPKRRDERGPGPGPGPGMGPEEVPEDRTGSDLSGPEDCNDKIDNDGNGKADCDDPGCATDPGCLGDPSKGEELGFEDCDNKIDDDKDRKVDCEDSDCSKDLSCIDDPSLDESVAKADPSQVALVSKLAEGGEVGMRAPDFLLPNLGRSGKQSLSELRGYIVVLNFWASWCGPCRKEVPALELTWQLYRDKHVVVVGVSIDDKKSAAEDFLGTFPVSYPMVQDKEGREAAEKWGVSSVPTLILIDAAGKIRERHQGYSRALLRKTVVAIDELLKE
jgi:thiol-disulfide isomerase/thioredoxin